jgi:hypothetical protein
LVPLECLVACLRVQRLVCLLPPGGEHRPFGCGQLRAAQVRPRAREDHGPRPTLIISEGRGRGSRAKSLKTFG